MKLRTGFVSNSSSSSFCVLGVTLSDEMKEKLDAGREKLKGTRVVTEYAVSGGEWECVGIYANSMQDDETPGQVKQELVNVLREVGIEIQLSDVSWIEDGGYNG